MRQEELNMKKIIKWSLIVISSIAILAVGTLWIQVRHMDQNTIKNQINKIVFKKTGRTLKLNGAMHFSLLPWPTLELNQLSLSNPKPFPNNSQLMTIDHMHVAIKPWALLRKHIQFQNITLIGAHIHLQILPSGQNNWTIQLQQKDKKANQTSKSHRTTAEQTTGNNYNLVSLLTALPSVSLKNSSLEINNQMTKQVITIKPINLSLKAKGNHQIFRLALSLSRQQPELILPLVIKGNIGAKAHTIQLDNIDISGHMHHANDKKVPFHFHTSATWDLKQHHLQAQQLIFALGTLQSKANQINVTHLFQPSQQIHAKVVIQPFNTGTLVNQITGKKESMKGKTIGINMSIIANRELIQIKQLKTTIGNGVVNGYFNLNTGRKPYINFKLSGTTIDLSPWMNQSSANTKKGANSSKKTERITANHSSNLSTPTSSIPRALKQLNGTGELRIDKLILGHTIFKDLSLQLNANQGTIKISPINLNAYNGRINAGVTMNIPNNAMTIAGNINGVNIGQWLKTAMGKSIISGIAKSQFTIHSSISHATKNLHQFYGQGYISINNGQLSANNELQTINSLSSQHNLGQISQQTKQTTFQSLYAHFTMQNGIIQNDKIQLQSSKLNLNGQGTISLPEQQYHFHVQLQKPQGKNPFPLIISGQLRANAHPKIKPDLVKLGQILLQKKMENRGSRVLGNDFGKTLNQGLRNFMNRRHEQ